ncbi:rolling circle replication-associated protein [Streptococcus orisasini]
MEYNKRIIQTSSYIEVWEYEKPIKYGFSKKDKPMYKKNESDERSRYKRLAKTRQNARHELMRLIDTNYCEKMTKFLTITTKENIQSRQEFNLLFDKFMKRLNYHAFKSKKKLLKYVAVLEKQKRGAYHAHILLFNLPYIPYKKLQKIWTLGSVWINLVDIDSKDNRGRYITKYMEKGITQEILEHKGKKSYYSSKNLTKPTQLRILDDESIDNLVSDKHIAYQNDYTAKLKINGEWIENKVKYRKIKI